MILAIDVGGTKTLVATFDETGAKIESIKFPTPVDYADFILELRNTIGNFSGQEYTSCCIAIPGKIDRNKGVGMAFGNLPWENVSISEDLKRFLNCSIFLENDANLAGLSEATAVLDTYKRALYITVSTGIGGVVIEDGKIDPNLRDAEIGHMLLEHDGKLQRWEEFASGKAIVRRTGKRAADIPEGDPEWYVVARNISIGLINVVANITPDCIIIGGGVGSHLDKFKDRLVEEMELYEDQLLTVPPILQAKNPEEAVIYGAYLYAKQNS